MVSVAGSYFRYCYQLDDDVSNEYPHIKSFVVNQTWSSQLI